MRLHSQAHLSLFMSQCHIVANHVCCSSYIDVSILGRSPCAESGILFRGPILQLTEGVQWFYYRENYTFKGSRGGPEFSRERGSNFFLMLNSKETHITCDFPGDPDPLSPSGSAHA